MNPLLMMVPYWIYRWLAIGVLAIGIFGFGYIKGSNSVQDKWNKEIAKQAVEILTIEKIRTNETLKVVTKYVDRIKIVHEKAETIIKEVPIYVTQKSDNQCIIPYGFVFLHNKAAGNESIPYSPGITNETPSEIKLSGVAETVAGNYGICKQTEEQLIALQEWILKMQKTNK